MIQLELMKEYKARTRNHPEKPDGTESVGIFVPSYEHTEFYEAQRFANQVFTGHVHIIKSNGRIVGRDGTTDWYVEGDTLTLPIGRLDECDCGGFKTYKSWAKEMHSTWCKVNT